MVNLYALEEQMRQRTDDVRREMDQARLMAERLAGPAQPAPGRQMERPAWAQYGARIWRFSSFPAWSRGRSAAKSIERGRL